MLEGALTPVFLSHAPLAGRDAPLRLTGTLERLYLAQI